MICQEVMELMQRYIDDDLDSDETSLMMDHVDRCPECAAMLAKLRHLSGELEQLPRVVPKFSLVDAILPELDKLHAQEQQAKAEQRREPIVSEAPAPVRSNRPQRRGAFGKLSGVVALGIAVGFLLFSQNGQWPFSPGKSDNDAASPMSAESGTSFMVQDQVGEVEGVQADRMMNKNEQAPAAKESAEPSKAPAQEAPEEQPASAPDGGDVSKSGGGSVGSDPSVGVTESPSDKTADKEPATGFAPATPTVSYPSPDGKWRAVVLGDSAVVEVIDAADDSVKFQSAPREGTIEEISWSNDGSELTYVWKDPDGNSTPLRFEVATATESNR